MPSSPDAKHPDGFEAEAGPAAEGPSLEEQARAIVRRNVHWALGLGLVPIPVIDVVALTGLATKMIGELSRLYSVDFSEERVRALVFALITGLGSVALASIVAGSLFKLVPVLGVLAGVVSGPLFAGALTRALGSLFVMHFEAGGTLFDFDAEAMRDHFRREFAQAKIEVTRMQNDAPNPPTP